MKKILIVLLAALLLFVSSCATVENRDEQRGGKEESNVRSETLIVRINDASEANNFVMQVAIYNENNSENNIAVGHSKIKNGSATVSFNKRWTGTNGDTYHVRIDLLNDSEESNGPPAYSYRHEYTQNGVEVLEILFSDYINPNKDIEEDAKENIEEIENFVEEQIENQWGIDYSNPEKYLQQTPSTEIPEEYYAEIESAIGEVETIEDIHKVYKYLFNNFEHYSDLGYEEDPLDYVYQIKTNRMMEMKAISGCTTQATLFASLLRHFDVPAIHIQGPGIGWALNDITEYTSGHAMVEAYIEGKWILLDSTNERITVDYDPTDPVIAFNTTEMQDNPNEDIGYFIMFKDYSVIDSESAGTDTKLNNLRNSFDKYLDDNYTLEYFEDNYPRK